MATISSSGSTKATRGSVMESSETTAASGGGSTQLRFDREETAESHPLTKKRGTPDPELRARVEALREKQLKREEAQLKEEERQSEPGFHGVGAGKAVGATTGAGSTLSQPRPKTPANYKRHVVVALVLAFLINGIGSLARAGK